MIASLIIPSLLKPITSTTSLFDLHLSLPSSAFYHFQLLPSAPFSSIPSLPSALPPSPSHSSTLHFISLFYLLLPPSPSPEHLLLEQDLARIGSISSNSLIPPAPLLLCLLPHLISFLHLLTPSLQSWLCFKFTSNQPPVQSPQVQGHSVLSSSSLVKCTIPVKWKYPEKQQGNGCKNANMWKSLAMCRNKPLSNSKLPLESRLAQDLFIWI